MAKQVAKKPVARRNRKNIEKGAAHIHSSFNNTIVTITDVNGNEIEIVNNQFIMPNKTVYITPTYKASVINPETADTVFIIVGVTLVLLFVWKKLYKKYLWLK